jgi:MFS family permease
VTDTRIPSSTASPIRPHLPLSVVVAMSCLAQFMVVLDSTIVTLALPEMRTGLHLSTNQQQWVLSGYLITLGGFLLLAARAGDLFGRKPVFGFGAIVFTAASLAGGLASDPAMLLVARIIQGTGAAALAPTSLSLITASHTDEYQRRRALTLWSIMGGAAGSAGVVLGGVLTTELNWRWVLFINVPLGIVLLAASVLTLLPAPARANQVRLDLPGALTVTLGMGALTYGLSQASSDGWRSPGVLAGLVAAAVLIGGFVAIEATSSRPLIPLTLFRPRGLLPVTVIMVIGGLASRLLVPIVGLRRLLVTGGLLAAIGTAWLGMVPDHPAYLAHILGPGLVAGTGLSLMLLAVTLTGTTGVSTEDAGAAAGLLNTSRQLGGALGLAVLVTVAATATTSAAHHATYLAALVSGYHVAFVVGACVMVVAALAALALPAAA